MIIYPKKTTHDPRLGSIHPSQLRRYLVSLGMKKKPFRRPGVDAYVGPTDMDGTELLILFPKSQQAPDYLRSMEYVFETLTGWEERSEEDIVSDILKLPVKGA